MENKVFPQMNTLVKMRESTLLSKQQKSALIGAEDAETAIKILGGTGFFTYSNPQQLNELNFALETEKQGLLDWCSKLSPEIPVAEIFEVWDTVHNIKVFVKEQVIGRNMPELYIKNKRCDKNFFLGLLQDAYTSLSPQKTRIKAVIEDARTDFSIHHSFTNVDLICTFWGHAEALRLSDKIDEIRITDFVKASIDLELLSILFQARENGFVLSKGLLSRIVTGFLRSDVQWLFSASEREVSALLHNSPYSEVWGSLNDKTSEGLFDVYRDCYLLNLCKKAKLEAFGVFPLFAFLYAKLLDIKNVRIIFTLKNVKVDKNEIEERLRGEYGI